MTITMPPAADWKIVARRKFVSDKIYPAGAEVPASAVGRNFESLLRSGYLAWQPPHPPLPEPVKKPKVHILTTADNPVDSWKRTKAYMVKQCNGDAALARDILDSDPAARELYKLACRVGTKVEAARRRVQSVGPDEIGL
jgi:hypothetical protein